MRVIRGQDRRGPITSSVIVIAALLVLGFTVVGGGKVQTVAPLIAAAVVIGLGYKRLLAWRSLVAALILIILFIPMRRYSLPASLPFNLEPYRLFVAFVAVGFLTSLLIDPRVRIRRSGLEGPLALYVFAILGSLMANSQRVGTVAGEVYKKLPFFASFFVVFYIIVSVVRHAREIDFLVRVLVIGGSVLGVFAVIESRTGYNVFDHLSSVVPFLRLNVAAVPNIAGRGGRLRVFASAQHSIALGALFAMLLPLAVYRAKAYKQPVWWLAAVLMLLGSLSTGSRTGVVMFAVEALVFFMLRASEMRRTWIAVIPALLVVHAAMPGALGTIRESFFPKGGIIAQQQDASVGSGRLATLGPALHREFHDPLVGEGFGTRVTKATDIVPVPNAPILDDEWLGILLETGIIGAFSLGWMFVRFARRTGRAAKRDTSARGWLLTCFCASVTAFAVGMLFYDAFGFYQSTFMMFIFLGLGVSTLLCPQHEWVEEEAVEGVRARSVRPVPAST